MFKKLGIGCLAVIGGGLLLIVIVVVIGIIAVANGSSSSSSKPQKGVMGKAMRLSDNLDVTLVNYTVSKGNGVETPKTGNEYVVTHWRFHNFRKSNTDVADTGFSVQSKGVITDSDFASSLTNNELGSAGTSLAPGATVSRDIVFQIVRGDKNAKVIYEPDTSDSKRKITWTVQG